MIEITATQPFEFVFNSLATNFGVPAEMRFEPYPGWRFAPLPGGRWRHEKIPEEAGVLHGASTAPQIRNAVIEECATALEQEAKHNERVSRDEKDFLPTRARAEHSFHVKRQCAELLRGLKK